MNKFEQASSVGHQMSVAGGGRSQVRCQEKEGTLSCDLSHDAFDIA